MSYTPPPGNNVVFNFVGAYAPPLATAVVFAFGALSSQPFFNPPSQQPAAVYARTFQFSGPPAVQFYPPTPTPTPTPTPPSHDIADSIDRFTGNYIFAGIDHDARYAYILGIMAGTSLVQTQIQATTLGIALLAPAPCYYRPLAPHNQQG